MLSESTGQYGPSNEDLIRNTSNNLNSKGQNNNNFSVVLSNVLLKMKKFTKTVHHENANREEEKLPVVYSSHYSVKFFGLRSTLHPFDAAKGHHIMQILKDERFLSDDKVHKPEEINEKELLRVHTKEYINSLKVKSGFHHCCSYKGCGFCESAQRRARSRR